MTHKEIIPIKGNKAYHHALESKNTSSKKESRVLKMEKVVLIISAKRIPSYFCMLIVVA